MLLTGYYYNAILMRNGFGVYICKGGMHEESESLFGGNFVFGDGAWWYNPDCSQGQD